MGFSGVGINFGHSDPLIKIAECWLNDVQGFDSSASDHIEKALDRVMADGITGMMAIMDESFGLCGELTTTCWTNMDFDLISRGKREG
jgi:hypothetical protein